MLRIHGLPFSAHTRKVIIAALEKELPYELVPALPLKPAPGWDRLSPLGLIPVLQDDEVTLADSSVIALYLEKKHPQPAFYPADPATLGRALWIEEFVDGGLARHVLHGLLLQRVFAPRFLNQPTDEALVRSSLGEFIPARLEYLERELVDDWFAGRRFTIADAAVASILVNFHYAGETLDGARYPKLRTFLERALTRESFRRAFATEIPAAAQLGGLDLSLLRTLGYLT